MNRRRGTTVNLLLLVTLSALLASCGRDAAVPASSLPPDVAPTGHVWYVDNTADAATADGSRAAPFARLALAESTSVPGDAIFVFAGDGTSRGLDGGIVLKDGQRLIGEGAGLAAAGIPAGAAPHLTNSRGDGVTLARGNTIEGLVVDAPTGAGISGRDVGALSVRGVTVQRAGGEGLTIRLEHDPNATIALADTDVLDGASSGVDVTALAASGSTITIAASELVGNRGNAVQLTYLGDGDHRFRVSDNARISTVTATGVRVFVGGGEQQRVEGRIERNAVTSTAERSGATGISAVVEGDATAAIVIDHNTVTRFGTFGIDVAAREGRGQLAATVTDNIVTQPAPFALSGMSFRAGDGVAGEANVLCVNLVRNRSEAGASGFGYERLQLAGTTHQLQSFTGNGLLAQSVTRFAGSGNEGSVGVLATDAVVAYTSAVCDTPRF